jgi:hypothetical protein
MFVNDTISTSDIQSETEVINTLLALALPDSINYGEVNATAISEEQVANVTNVGNVRLNLSLSGYGHYEGDGNAMNCTQGDLENISIFYEKYNLSASSPDVVSLEQFDVNYTNLTSAVIVRQFDLDYRTQDGEQFDGVTNSTYWRIYVPIGVGGTCTGNIIFGAVQSPEA